MNNQSKQEQLHDSRPQTHGKVSRCRHIILVAE
jgi:hypothetical protein